MSGAVPHNPVVVVLATAPGAVMLGILIALGPALWATRQRPGALLRTE